MKLNACQKQAILSLLWDYLKQPSKDMYLRTTGWGNKTQTDLLLTIEWIMSDRKGKQ